MNNAQYNSLRPPAFIVGMPRAATTWLCRCLNMHPDAAAFGESLYWGRRYIKPLDDGCYTPAQLRMVLERFRSGSCVKDFSGDGPGRLEHAHRDAFAALIGRAFPDPDERLTPSDVFLRICHMIGEAEGASQVVEKTPHHLNWIDRIVAAIPEARFIIMVREPYSFMLSYKHQGDRKHENVRREFERRYHPLGCAVVWRGCMRAAMNASSRLTDRALLVKHEDIHKRPEEVIASIQQFLGLEALTLAEKVPADNTSFPTGQRPELQADDVFWMNRIAGGTIQHAGYALRTAPLKFWPIVRSVLTLPWWTMRNVLSLSRIVDGPVLAYLWRWVRGSEVSRKSDRSTSAADF